MNIGIRKSLAAGGVIVALLVTGAAVAYAVTTGGMDRPMVGIVVSGRNAGLSVAPQPGATRVLRVADVRVPGPSWVVVHLDENGKPGMRIGLQHVRVGKSAVDVRLEGARLTSKLIVAVHADRGTPGRFDFAMDRFATSADKPYFVDGKELAREVTVR